MVMSGENGAEIVTGKSGEDVVGVEGTHGHPGTEREMGVEELSLIHI